MKDYTPMKGQTMFRRFLGSIFLYFYILPAISRAIRKIVVPTISKTLTKMVDEEMKKVNKDHTERRSSTSDWTRNSARSRA